MSATWLRTPSRKAGFATRDARALSVSQASTPCGHSMPFGITPTIVNGRSRTTSRRPITSGAPP